MEEMYVYTSYKNEMKHAPWRIELDSSHVCVFICFALVAALKESRGRVI